MATTTLAATILDTDKERAPVAPIVGLTRTADLYGIGVILLAVTPLAITLVRGRRA